MSDTQAAMREFRFLDDKRKGGGLSHIEEQRWIDLGGQLGMSAQQGYYGQDGVWYAYPPGYDPNTGLYYGQQPQQPQYAPPQQYYDPNAGYYPPQPQQGYDPNAGYYDPNQQQEYDPLAQAYPQQQPAPYAPPAQWSQPEHPQQQGEWPQNYDPNTGQYYDPSGYPQPAASQPYSPPLPEQWQPPAPMAVHPIPIPAPIAAADDGPLEVGEDEVMEVTDDDVTLLDSSAPISTAMPAAEPYRSFDAEKPLTASVLSTPAPSADMFGDLRSVLSHDEPAPLVAAVEWKPSSPVEATPVIPVEVMAEPLEPSILAEVVPEPADEWKPSFPVEPMVEPVAAAPMIPIEVIAEPIAAAPSILADVVPEPVEAIAEPMAPPPEPSLPVDVIPEPISATPEQSIPIEVPEPITVPSRPSFDFAAEVTAPNVPRPDERVTIPDLSKLRSPEPIAAAVVDAQPVADLIPAPAVTIPEVSRAEVPFEPEIDEEPEEMPSIMVADDLGAESFAAPIRHEAAEEELELPPVSELAEMLGHAKPPAPPPPSEPDPVSPPLALTNVAPISATQHDLYPDGVPAPLSPPPPAPAPVSFDLEPKWEPPASDGIPDPRPSIPISIQVEEPVQEGTFDAEPILEASVEPEPVPPAAPLPSFVASFDDLSSAHEPELPVSTHTGFEASLGDLPPSIANEPPPPIIDVELAIDDKPVPVEIPMDLGGSADDKIELARTSDFLDFPTTSSADTGSFSGEGESLVESGTLATMANPVAASSGRAPIELPPDEPDAGVPLASNADFLGMSELNNTGEAWTKRDAGVTVAEEPEAIIQGVELEDDAINAEITAELAEAVVEPDPWPAPVAIAPPAPFVPKPPGHDPFAPRPAAAAANVPRPLPPPGPVPFVPKPPAPAAFIPVPPVRTSSAPAFAPLKAGSGPDHSLFETKGSLLREEPSAPEIRGEHRVILHTIEGQVKRGVLRDTKLGDDTVGLEAQPGAVERIPRPRIKAIFFMLPAGQKAPPPTGDKLRVTFKDGRQLAGFSSDHRASGIGFFVVPADNRTNTERIFIYRSSVEKVAVD